MKKILRIKKLLLEHIENECTECDYVGERCGICQSVSPSGDDLHKRLEKRV
jgi:hypothetical protein